MIEDKFKQAFGEAPAQIGVAPGRVNLIGEHIDYNGGTVLPTALTVVLRVALGPRSDRQIQIRSDRFEGIIDRDMGLPRQGNWADYAAGAVIFAHEAGYLQGGANLYIESTIPDGAGLSSSAALIVAILKAARDAGEARASDAEIAVLARRVENEFIGMPCGIMDQMAVAVARTGQAIALDTNSLEYEVIDIPDAYHMAVVHSGVQRQLADGRYAARKEECDEAKAALGNPDLCLLTDEEWQRAQTLPAPIRRRVRHCMTEHQRTLDAARALKNEDMGLFGRLMNESHLSMRDEFEMSTHAIDALVADAQKFGAHGARLTGGGFGGCIVACVEANGFEDWKGELLRAHPNAYFVC